MKKSSFYAFAFLGFALLGIGTPIASAQDPTITIDTPASGDNFPGNGQLVAVSGYFTGGNQVPDNIYVEGVAPNSTGDLYKTSANPNATPNGTTRVRWTSQITMPQVHRTSNQLMKIRVQLRKGTTVLLDSKGNPVGANVTINVLSSS